MKKTSDPHLIGGFVLGAMALAVLILLSFGGRHLFSTNQRYVAYFQGSVNGLNLGAPVKLKGVSIGSVTDIRVQYDLKNSRVLTPVIVEIDLSKVSDIHEHTTEAHPPSFKELVDRGLRARLNMQTLVTGQLYVDVNFYPNRPVRLMGAVDMELPEIPTIPSSKEEIENTIDEAIVQFRKLPIQETFDATLRSVRQIETILAAPETQATITNLNRTLGNLDRLINHADARIDGVAGELEVTLKDGRSLVKRLDGRSDKVLDTTEQSLRTLTETLNKAQTALAAVEHLGNREVDIGNTLKDVSAAARSVRLLADYLERYPDAVFRGRVKGLEGR